MNAQNTTETNTSNDVTKVYCADCDAQVQFVFGGGFFCPGCKANEAAEKFGGVPNAYETAGTVFMNIEQFKAVVGAYKDTDRTLVDFVFDDFEEGEYLFGEVLWAADGETLATAMERLNLQR